MRLSVSHQRLEVFELLSQERIRRRTLQVCVDPCTKSLQLQIVDTTDKIALQGILRLSDLRAEAPNSNYPLFIIASEDRRRKVFEELRRPTFSGPCLRLNEVIRFLGYEKLREIDELSKNAKDFDTNALMTAGENVPLV